MTGKIGLYRTLRLNGLRMYSSRNWLNISGVNSSVLKRFLSIPAQADNEEDVGFFEKMKNNMGFKGSLRYFPSTLQYSGFRLYLSAAEASRYNKIYDYVELPDTMASWHKLTTLHIWLIMVRLSTEGREGKIVRNEIIENFNTDMKAKSKEIGKEWKISVKGEELEMLYQMFLAALLNYDEGVLGSDRHLAGAVWRSLFDLRADVDPTNLETMVAYIRKQVAFLQKIDSKSMLTNGLMPFLPVDGETVPKSTVEALKVLVESDLQFKKS